MELARRIKEHRARLGMSQADLARALFVTRQTISNWETSRTYPDAQSLLLMSGLFGVSVDSLLKDDSQEMKEALAAGSRKMNRLGAVMAAFGLACAAWVVVGIALDWDTALIAVTGGEGIHQLGYLYAFVPCLLGALIMLAIALIVNNIPKAQRYPQFWW